MEPFRLSLIIPTLNEAHNIQRLLNRIATLSWVEIIICDGGSTDGTPALIKCYPKVKITHSPTPGRGVQMAQGANIATGHRLLFAHADCQLGKPHLLAAANTPLRFNQAGYFIFGCASRNRRFRALELATRWRCRLLELPYGDQGIFLHRAWYFDIGGFATMGFLEDVDFVRRIKKAGTLRPVDLILRSSPRAWKNRSILGRGMINSWLVFLHWCGVPAAPLGRFYG